MYEFLSVCVCERERDRQREREREKEREREREREKERDNPHEKNCEDRSIFDNDDSVSKIRLVILAVIELVKLCENKKGFLGAKINYTPDV